MLETDPALYPRFSDEEISRRRRLVTAFMAERNLDALVVFGWSASARTAQADVYYLSGYMGMRDNYVVFPREGEPVLFAQSYNHVPNASAVSFLDDVRWGGVDNGATVGAELLSRSLRKIGVVGWMPYQQYESMRTAVGGSGTFVDVTAGFRRLRLEKSPEELEWLERGAAFTDAALEGLREALQPGVREYELADAIEGAYLRQGGLTTFYYLASTPMSTPDRCVPSQVLSSRRLEPGDVVSCEIAVSYAGYAGQGLRTFTVGADPTPQIAELHAVAEDTFHRVASAIRTGAGVADLWAASDVIAERGFTVRDGLVHGYGIGLLPPSLRTRQTTHDLDDDWVFETNQTIVIQPNVITEDETVGVQTGELCVVTEDGARSLHSFPLELIRVG
ncbi:MAG TPA: Xaa-Pro peptidase family protein [Acidimicrobiia bacterium]|nr:Xaa-Pro peptidase family protein [Acidimicrobiia bacterium]